MTTELEAQLEKERRKGEEWGQYKAKLDDVDKDLKELITTVKEMPDYIAKAYAVKLVEKIVFSAVGLALVAVIGGLLTLVVQK